MRTPLTLAANHGEVGGGEVMLLHIAEAARALGREVTVVGPRHPGKLVQLAAASGFAVRALAADDRSSYARHLRAWDRRERTGLLWCNGLVPAVATAGHRDRVVHLHQVPVGRQQTARAVAALGARAVVVPSASMGQLLPHTDVLLNWTGALDLQPCRLPTERPTIGFLGRLTTDKGVHVLAQALGLLRAEGVDARLVLAGDARFGRAQDRRVVGSSLAPVADAVEHVGWVDRVRFFSSVDLAVFPSTWAEPFGLVAAEAMGSGVPFVVTDAGALTEVAGTDHPWVARAGDAADLARVMCGALAAPAALRAELRTAARQRWDRRYSPGAGSARLAVVLDRLDATRAGR